MAPEEWLLQHETTLRLSVFASILVVMLLLQRLMPWRGQDRARSGHQLNNLILVAVDSLAVRLLAPMLPTAAALWAAEQGLGLLNVADLPPMLSLVLAVIALDGVIYAQHVAVHKVPLLWRLHRVHHSDTAVDATTGLRFHPIEILLSILIKLVAVTALGAPVLAVVIFEVLLNGGALFNHGRIKLPPRLERLLRWVIVTPEMHRIHHSVIQAETDSNYGFNLSLWDRLFGTHTPTAASGDAEITQGIETFRDEREQSILQLLSQPFRKAR